MLLQIKSNIGSLLVIAFLLAFIFAVLFFLKKDTSQLQISIDGVYYCSEVSDTKTQQVLATIPMRITLKGEIMIVDNSETGEIILEGSFERRLPGKNDHIRDCEYLVITGAPQVFSPRIYYKDQRLFYLKINKEVNQLFIFERT